MKRQLSPILFLLIVCFMITAFIAGCSGGGGGSNGGGHNSPTPSASPSPSASISPSPTPTDTTAPTVSSVNPADGAMGVQTNATVTIEFSEDMDPTSINNTNIQISNWAGQANGTITYDQGTRTAIFTPTSNLANQMQYKVTVTTGVTDTSGNALEADYVSYFIVGDKAWRTAHTIEGYGWTAYKPQVAVDPSGNAIAIWRQNAGGRDNIHANRYVPGTGWETHQPIETENTGDAEMPQVDFDSAGNAVSVWYQFDGKQYSIYSNRYSVGVGWGTAQLIETDNTGNAINPQVAVDPAGNAITVWQQWDGVRWNVWANRYATGIGWGAPQLIETENLGDARFPQVAIDPTGNAVVVWQQINVNRGDVWANRYVAGTGWGTAQLIETDNVNNARYPDVAIDSSGNAIAVWNQYDGSRYSIFANRYMIGTGWGIAQLIETDNAGDAHYPKIALDPLGNAVAVWFQDDGTRYNIWSNRYVAGTGWGTTQLLENDDAGAAKYPQVAVDQSGNAVVVWEQNDGTVWRIWARRYISGTGWVTAQLLDTADSRQSLYPHVDVDPSGNAIAVWQQMDETRANIWVNEFR